MRFKLKHSVNSIIDEQLNALHWMDCLGKNIVNLIVSQRPTCSKHKTTTSENASLFAVWKDNKITAKLMTLRSVISLTLQFLLRLCKRDVFIKRARECKHILCISNYRLCVHIFRELCVVSRPILIYLCLLAIIKYNRKSWWKTGKSNLGKPW